MDAVKEFAASFSVLRHCGQIVLADIERKGYPAGDKGKCGRKETGRGIENSSDKEIGRN